jgi:hypothetical protein
LTMHANGWSKAVCALQNSLVWRDVWLQDLAGSFMGVSTHYSTSCICCQTPLKWIALTWQGGLAQVCQSLETKNPQAIYRCDGRDCPSGYYRCPMHCLMHIRCLTGRIVFLYLVGRRAKGERNLFPDTVMVGIGISREMTP